MLKRKIYNKLIEWKNKKNKECLLIKGARQVGKTYIVREFGRTYKNYIEINFVLQPEFIDVFNGNLNVDDIILNLSSKIKDKKFVQDETLIFFDEIQACPNARTSLKSFAIDGRYDVVASGSLLGLSYGQDVEIEEEIKSIPVGYEKEILMKSMDFEEFLWAIGVDVKVIEKLKEYFDNIEKIPDALNETIGKYLLQYIVVGGMPEVVNRFLECNNYYDVYEEQMKILNANQSDILKHAKNVDKIKIKKCYDSLPKQLAKENKKFQYSIIEKGSTKRKYESSINWLEDTNLIDLCKNVATPLYPLMAYEEDDYYKIYINDIGLLTAMYGFDIKDEILNKKLIGPLKGAIYENLIACMLIKNNYKLNFFKPKENDKEIEFLISKNAKIIPIEVKARNGATISLNDYIEEYKPEKAYKLIDGNVGVEGCKITIPHYMAMFI